jgi:DNA ligase (NAD+)
MSGPLADLSRVQMHELIARAGGKASGTVSAKTSLVVAGEKAGSKKAKAESLDIEVIDPEAFAQRIAAYLG